ncbi:mechanosensitive ion channel family protein [uncultured Sulfitobacter sp.]|uniref:mechanosensitive ion channel family protein n=1 Tax=uncultured Sulfitobacter sp. TaxID=191468 RepID=UPI00260AB7D3|nr:mechanosensitive ion channel family protein [uncultured Sulfitobacter sp.]
MIALRRATAALISMLVIMLSGPVSAQTDTPILAPSTNDIHEFTRLLADERVQEWLRQQADEAETATTAEALGVRDQLDALILRTQDRISALVRTWEGLGQAPELVQGRWREQVTDDRRVQSLTFVLIFLFLGAGLEWLFRQYSNPIRRRLEITQFQTPAKRITAAITRAGLALAGLLAFAVGSIGAFSAFEWPPILFVLILNLLMAIVVIRVVGTMLLLFFAPFVPRLRLVPVSTGMARLISRTALAFAAVLVVAVAFRDVFAQVIEVFKPQGGENALLAVSVMLAGVVSLTALLCLHAGFFIAARLNPGAGSKSARKWRGFLSLLIVLSLAFWILDLRPIMWSILCIGILIVSLKLLRAWVDHAFDTAIADYMAKLPPPPVIEASDDIVADAEVEEVAEVVDPYETYRPIAQRVVRFAAIISVGFVLALIWNLGIFESAENPTVMQRLFSVLLDSAAALLIADLLWTWARTAIDRRLNAYRPPTDGSAPGPEARMATLLPLLRVVLMVTLLLMVAMSILSSMGVNIAPILAGASVLGIAIGFGAQSLVKDVVSGIFFLIDDAFRVGEYVEIDQLRGTVEKISIRSLQIRHHRGAVHTLPFGELKSMTNYSRDWVIMKLEFRVPFDTDLKLVKKLIKQVGAQLKENPDYGDSIIETLKSQGVRRMEEFNMVVGVKFMTRPGEQWLVRRDAYQGVRDIFEANGIRMAERNVKVEIAGEEALTDEQRKAASAAAHEATTNKLPPGPIPDEP